MVKGRGRRREEERPVEGCPCCAGRRESEFETPHSHKNPTRVPQTSSSIGYKEAFPEKKGKRFVTHEIYDD